MHAQSARVPPAPPCRVSGSRDAPSVEQLDLGGGHATRSETSLPRPSLAGSVWRPDESKEDGPAAAGASCSPLDSMFFVKERSIFVLLKVPLYRYRSAARRPQYWSRRSRRQARVLGLTTPAMHLEEIVLDGFKSYAVRTTVSGFDREFNAITGLAALRREQVHARVGVACTRN